MGTQKDKNYIDRDDALNMLKMGGQLFISGDFSPRQNRNAVQVAIKYNGKVYVILSEETSLDFCFALL